VDVAATLELRGHSLAARPRPRRQRSLDDGPLLWTAAAIAVTAIGARLAGAGGFETYPRVEFDAGAATLVLSTALLLLGALPFALRRSRG
jgi:hypothetical protein